MSTSNACNLTVGIMLSSVGLGFTFLHTYRFDQWRCFVPRRKEWFRTLLTVRLPPLDSACLWGVAEGQWMLVFSSLGMFIWCGGWAVIKYKLGYVIIPGMGAMPVPPPLFPEKYARANNPLNAWVVIAFCCQISLNAEEGLYWFHLMRAVRQPKSAKSWLNSTFFLSWVAISVSVFVIMIGATYIHIKGDMIRQEARLFTTGGAIELVVVLLSSIIIWRFPSFLADVKNSGAGPEVRSRLHFYHEGNKVRTFCRIGFVVGTLALGIDGLTTQKRLNAVTVASDLMEQMTFGCYWIQSIVSIVLYLPRNWSSNPRSGQVMVARQAPRRAEAQQASNALMSLLREGGQWDETDDLRAGMTNPGMGMGLRLSGQPASAVEGEEKDEWDLERARITALENFTSPFAVRINEEAPMPTEIRIRVEREVQDDRDLQLEYEQPGQSGSGPGRRMSMQAALARGPI